MPTYSPRDSGHLRHYYSHRLAERILDGTNMPGGLNGAGDPTLWLDDASRWHMAFGSNPGGSTVDTVEAVLAAGQNLGVSAATWRLAVTATPIISRVVGQWDALAIETPAYVRAGEVERLYYVGYDDASAPTGGAPLAIGFAEWDGEAWARHGAAVLEGSEAWEFNGAHAWVLEPTLYHDGDRYHLWYVAGSGRWIAYANSDDGITFGNRRRVFNPNVAWSPEVVKIRDHLEMWVADSRDTLQGGLWQLRGAAPSGDPADWTGARQVIADRAQSWSSDQMYGPSVRLDPATGICWCFFTARDPVNGATSPHIGRLRVRELP